MERRGYGIIARYDILTVVCFLGSHGGDTLTLSVSWFSCRGFQVGAGGLDAGVPTGTVIGLYDDADQDGCILDYDITDAQIQVLYTLLYVYICKHFLSV